MVFFPLFKFTRSRGSLSVRVSQVETPPPFFEILIRINFLNVPRALRWENPEETREAIQLCSCNSRPAFCNYRPSLSFWKEACAQRWDIDWDDDGWWLLLFECSMQFVLEPWLLYVFIYIDWKGTGDPPETGDSLNLIGTYYFFFLLCLKIPETDVQEYWMWMKQGT